MAATPATCHIQVFKKKCYMKKRQCDCSLTTIIFHHNKPTTTSTRNVNLHQCTWSNDKVVKKSKFTVQSATDSHEFRLNLRLFGDNQDAEFRNVVVQQKISFLTLTIYCITSLSKPCCSVRNVGYTVILMPITVTHNCLTSCSIEWHTNVCIYKFKVFGGLKLTIYAEYKCAKAIQQTITKWKRDPDSRLATPEGSNGLRWVSIRRGSKVLTCCNT